MSKKFEAHVYVKIAQAELGNSNSDRADMFITKATGLMRQEPSIADDPRISLKYKVRTSFQCHAGRCSGCSRMWERHAACLSHLLRDQR